MTETSSLRLPSETITALIATAQRARQRGDQVAARTLLRVLAVRQPNEPRIWLALATVAETRDEQRRALEQVIALDPQHPLARRGLARFETPQRTVAPMPVPVPVVAETFAPTAQQLDEPEREVRWPLYALLAIAGAILLAALLLVRPAESQRGDARDPAATPLAAVIAAPSPAPSSNATALGSVATSAPPTAATDVSVITVPLATTSALEPPTSVLPTALAPPQPTNTPLALGTIVTSGEWYATLLKPEHAVLLDGSIGALQPRGRFVLALITLGNNRGSPARVPATLFTVVDQQGNRYPALPAASTAYLAAYGRAQYGDRSLEDDIPSGGNVSVPVIFDVPVSVQGLTLHVGTETQGWTIGAQ